MKAVVAIFAALTLGACAKNSPPASRLIKASGEYPFGDRSAIAWVDVEHESLKVGIKDTTGFGSMGPGNGRWKTASGWFVYAETAMFDRVWVYDGLEQCLIYEIRKIHSYPQFVSWDLVTWRNSVPHAVWDRLPASVREKKGTQPAPRLRIPPATDDARIRS